MAHRLRHILLLIGLALPLAVSALGAIPDHPETGGQEALCMPDSAATPRMDTPAAWSFPGWESRVGRTRSHTPAAPRSGPAALPARAIPNDPAQASAGANALAPRVQWRVPDERYRLLYPFHDFW